MVCVKVVCERECVTKLFVEAAGPVGAGGSGIQNQKQEPHTKIWGMEEGMSG
jgi:hypothetical protein